MAPGLSVQVEVLSARHDRSEFCCGNSLLDDYLRHRAGQDQKRFASVAYVLVEKDSANVRGYYTLSAMSVDLGRLPDDLARKLPRYPAVPVTMLGRLAVDKPFQGSGLGEFLLLDALKMSLSGANKIASTGVVVDAIDNNAKRFYKYFGFIPFKDHRNRLYLPMKTIARLFS